VVYVPAAISARRVVCGDDGDIAAVDAAVELKPKPGSPTSTH